MGEAKRRMAADPHYGRAPKNGRGLVVTCPVEIDGGMIRIQGGTLDPQELRLALLFWDRLAWPTSNAIFIGGAADEKFLEECGVLSRPHYVMHGDGADIMVRTYLQAFADLDAKEPGCWALAQGRNTILLRENALEDARGVLVSLYSAIPVPNFDVPLQEVLEFRERRRDELLALRAHIDSLYQQVTTAVDSRHQLRVCFDEIDRACADVLRVQKERGFAMRLADLKASFNLNPLTLGELALKGSEVGTQYGMPTLGGLIGAGLAAISLNADFGFRGRNLKGNPYRYVYDFHKELI